ncbi:acyl-CoA synthetase [Nocardia seriolae]|uniref:acyl-CoA synthetase n=1 Tax=Nocardia seriolae TaxID=37332 RepID=UPI00051A2F3B|nr:acyl-CoA synthetase [Nocardia seriolae]MTJ61650.1 AMP-binding protein [Nocardia seriolae]MTJ76087.1 AMP-binding protein [Nocardia seriolae]MTJ86668.1 AMP-binding protein [Nocardia seriolae]MTK30663.1 AMP-binding protein [Nocardia seriolae]MTK39617.1 AMP-binding protein [Nocardia seriolae]
MASVLEKAQQRVVHTAETLRGLRKLRELGLTDPRKPMETIRTALEGRVFGPPATAVRRAARMWPERAAVADEHGELTYRELDEQSNALARGLQRMGVKPGTVVAVLSRDHRGLLLTMVALGKLGARLALMNTGFAKPQFAQVCERENVKAVLHDSEFLGLLDALPPELPRVLTWVDEGIEIPSGATTLDELIAANAKAPLPAPKKPGGFIILTSGTTGLPKGAPRERTGPLATVQMVDRIDFPQGGTMVIVSPIFHSTGFGTWLACCAFGNKVVTIRRFDAESTLRLIAEHRAQMLVAVPTMLHRMVELDKTIRDSYDHSSLRGIVIAGSALSPELSVRTAEVFGPVLYNLYGSTECAVATVARPEDLAIAPGTAGRAPTTCEVALFDDDGRRIRAKNVKGRIFIRSGSPFKGYTDGRHKEVIDGYMSSGDVGHFDDRGLLFVDGRDDDMIVSGGENVFPQEVENLLLERPDIFDAAVVGVDDGEFGKRLRAFVVPEPGAELTADEIKAHVKANLARYKVPRDVFFLDDLPRNATGKLLRRVLVEYEPPTM